MGQQIIKQPNGRLAIFSSNTDTVIVWDATVEEVANWFAEQAATSARREAYVKLEHVLSGNASKAYYQFAMTWEEALRMDEEHGGDAWRGWKP